MRPISVVLPTVGEIANRYRVPVHRIEYAIRTRSIRPSGWAGNARVFDEHAIRQIANVLGIRHVGRVESARSYTPAQEEVLS